MRVQYHKGIDLFHLLQNETPLLGAPTCSSLSAWQALASVVGEAWARSRCHGQDILVFRLPQAKVEKRPALGSNRSPVENQGSRHRHRLLGHRKRSLGHVIPLPAEVHVVEVHPQHRPTSQVPPSDWCDEPRDRASRGPFKGHVGLHKREKTEIRRLSGAGLLSPDSAFSRKSQESTKGHALGDLVWLPLSEPKLEG